MAAYDPTDPLQLTAQQRLNALAVLAVGAARVLALRGGAPAAPGGGLRNPLRIELICRPRFMARVVNTNGEPGRSCDDSRYAKGVEQAVAAVDRMTLAQLREKYLELFGEPTRSGNRDFLFKRLAWRVRSLAEGTLSERARRRAGELARDADIRTTLPPTSTPRPS